MTLLTHLKGSHSLYLHFLLATLLLLLQTSTSVAEVEFSPAKRGNIGYSQDAQNLYGAIEEETDLGETKCECATYGLCGQFSRFDPSVICISNRKTLIDFRNRVNQFVRRYCRDESYSDSPFVLEDTAYLCEGYINGTILPALNSAIIRIDEILIREDITRVICEAQIPGVANCD
jgi:hypothetical protein